MDGATRPISYFNSSTAACGAKHDHAENASSRIDQQIHAGITLDNPATVTF